MQLFSSPTTISVNIVVIVHDHNEYVRISAQFCYCVIPLCRQALTEDTVKTAWQKYGIHPLAAISSQPRISQPTTAYQPRATSQSVIWGICKATMQMMRMWKMNCSMSHQTLRVTKMEMGVMIKIPMIAHQSFQQPCQTLV